MIITSSPVPQDFVLLLFFLLKYKHGRSTRENIKSIFLKLWTQNTKMNKYKHPKLKYFLLRFHYKVKWKLSNYDLFWGYNDFNNVKVCCVKSINLWFLRLWLEFYKFS